MYRSRYKQQKGAKDYLLPFFIIICVGVIVVLVWKLWVSIFSEEVQSSVYLHLVSGSAEMKPWGSESVFDLSSDALIMQGDEVSTSAGSRAIIEFSDGTLMRIDGQSNVIFEEFNFDIAQPKIKLLLVNGNVWFNKFYKDTGNTNIEIDLGSVVAVSNGRSIFEVENNMDKVLRVAKGDDVVVNVLAQDKTSIVESEEVGVGQEIVFSSEVLERYWQFQSPSVIEAFSDEFKQTDWFKWNDEEDKAPTQFVKDASGQFVKVEPEIAPEEDGVNDNEDLNNEEELKGEENLDSESPEDESPEPSGDLQKPTLSSVSGGTQTNAEGFYVVKGNPATIVGTAPGASKLVVNGFTLQKFKAGDSSWTYYANADYGYMKEGENTYEIYSMDANGKKSETLIVKVLYSPVPAPVPAPTENIDTSNEGQPEVPPAPEQPAEGVVVNP